MKTSTAFSSALDLAQSHDLRGLDTREQYAATLHHTTEQYLEQGGATEDAAYFLIAAARAALENKPEFSTNAALAREYLQAALELL